MKRLIISIMLVFSLATSVSANSGESLDTGHQLILAGIDSLTNGAGGTKYVDYLLPKLVERYGDGGPGYVPFDYHYAATEKYSYGAKEVKSISSLKAGEMPAIYSFDNQGSYCANCTNGSIDYKVGGAWTNAKVYYLIHPNGGYFKIGYLKTFTKAVKVDTKGKLGIGVITLPSATSDLNGQIAVREISGEVAIYGGLFTNDSGVSISRIGKGGDKLANHNSTDPTFRQKWVDLLKPTMYLFNGGANDRNDLTAEQYDKIMREYLAPFDNVVLIRPNDIQNDSKVNGFEVKMKSYAQEKGYTFVSNKQVLGDFTTAKNKGYMLDGVHPNVEGNKRIAENLLNSIFKERYKEDILREIKNLMDQINKLIVEFELNI